MIKVRIKGEYGEVEISSEPKQMYDINRLPKIVGDKPIYDAIKAYEALKKISEESK